MFTVGGLCPVCEASMYLERLRCPQCGTAMEGAFSLSPLFGLRPEHLNFVELLVKHRGNIQRVAEELGVSYRTARNRMDEIATLLGFVLPEKPYPTPERRREILEGLAGGEFSAEEAARLLRGEEE